MVSQTILNRLDRRWWFAPKEEVHDTLKTALDLAMTHDRGRIDYYRALALLHDGHDRQAMWGGRRLADDQDYRVPRNVLRRLVSTAHARLISTIPRPFYCSDGGDFELRQKLEDLNTAVHGLFLANKVDSYANLAQRHALVWGDGFVKVSAVLHTKRPHVCVERVYPWEVYIDPLDGLYGEPRCYYQVRWVDRAHMIASWPKYAREIFDAESCRPEWAGWLDGMSDPVRVVEAWYLDPDGEMGRHVVALSNATLVDEPYGYDAPPLVRFQHSAALTSFWGDGLAHEVAGQQMELNDVMGALSETIKLGAWPSILAEKQAEVEVGQLTNSPMKVIKYKGIPPIIQTAQGLTAEASRYADGLASNMYETSGVSQYAATSTKPAGLQSGRSLRIFADQQEGNLREGSDLRAQSYLALGMALVRAQRAVSEVEPNARVIFSDPRERKVVSLKWREIDLPDDGLEMVAAPISILPSTPAAKAEALEQYASAGAITMDDLRANIDLPDLKSMDATATAPRKAIEQQMLKMVRDGVPQYPEPFFPLDLALQLAGQHYCQAVVDGAAEDRLELVRRYIQAVTDLKTPPPPVEGEMALPPEMPPEEMPPVEGELPPDAMPPEMTMPPQEMLA
ncbi:MAG: hypothetical protein IPL79_19920 [Myxococcales bacterium]|nr:hypothetical protein [Myxococcales bacterium]